MQRGGDLGQPRGARAQRRIGVESPPGLGGVGLGLLAEQVVGEPVLVAHLGSSSSSISRNRSSAWTMRIFTVPSGIPVRSAIWRWLRPS